MSQMPAKQDRVILHCDLNGFFASVECLFRPELKTVPMAVCGNVESRHGIILAKNELAKKFGVVTAETVWQAKKKCPELVLVAPRHDRYTEYSKKVNAIYDRFTDMVEPFGIDESWLDVTGSLKLFETDGKGLADTIRETVKRELGLTISVGVSFNKVFAKLGSDYKKPDATTVIDRENFRQMVFPLPVTALLFVGKASAEQLNRLGIQTIGELAAADRSVLRSFLGKMGETIYDYANGLDTSPVGRADEKRQVKSVGNGSTFPKDLTGEEEVLAGIAMLAETVGARLRRYGLKCTVVQIQIKDPYFKSISRQTTLPASTCSTKCLRETAMTLLKASWSLKAPIRALTVTAAGLLPQDRSEKEQLSLFDVMEKERRNDRQEKLEQTIDKIRGKYGWQSIHLANTQGQGYIEEQEE